MCSIDDPAESGWGCGWGAGGGAVGGAGGGAVRGAGGFGGGSGGGCIVYPLFYGVTSPSEKQDLLTVHVILTIKTHKALSLFQGIQRTDTGTHNEDEDSNDNYDNEEVLSLENYVNNDKNKNPYGNISCYSQENNYHVCIARANYCKFRGKVEGLIKHKCNLIENEFPMTNIIILYCH